MRYLFSCFLALFVPFHASATPLTQDAEIRGHVLDPARRPVAGATVTLSAAAQPTATSAQVITDDEGSFTLAALPGSYLLTVNAAGFLEASQRLSVSRSERRLIEVVLSIPGVAETVTVDAVGSRVVAVQSATKTMAALRDVPQAVTVVSRSLVSETRASSMADVVRFIPGVGMAQGEGNRDTPVLRGSSSTADFFIDGVRDDTQYFRDVYNIEQIEALKGPNAMIFGRGGAGGVINRVTRQAEWLRSREVAVQAGSSENRRITADFGDGFNQRVASRFTGLYENSETYRAGVSVERYGFQPSVAFRLGESTTVRASYEYFHDERTADRGIPSFAGRPLASSPEQFFGDPEQSLARVSVNLIGGTIEHRFGSTVTWRHRVSYGGYDKFYQNVFPGAVNVTGTLVSLSAYNNATDRKNLFNQSDVIVRTRTGWVGHTVLVGAELGRQATENLRLTGYFSTLGPTVTTVQAPVNAPLVSLPIVFRPSASDADNRGMAHAAAVYVQDQVVFSPAIQAVLGARLDLFDIDFRDNRSVASVDASDRVVSPRVGLIYRPFAALSIYGNYSRTYLPRAGEQLSSLSISNRSLEPETFRSYEAGLKWDVRRALGLTAAVYRLNRGNVAVPDPADPTRTLLVDAQRTRGAELEANGAISSRWRIIAGYAYQDGTITRSISTTARAGARLPQLPRHSASLWSTYQLAKRWSGAAGVVYRGDIFPSTDNLVVVPAFTRVDAALFCDVTAKVRFQLNAENLLDTEYFVSAHSNNNITPGAPRSFKATAIVRF